jgi:predicted nucleic acid-binding protein
MKNVTLSLPEELLKKSREYAKKHGTSLNQLIREAIDIQILNRLSFWDSLIISAAAGSKCSILFSEDLNHGQEIKGVRVQNPFR